MAGPYYVDLGSPGAWNGRTGVDKTTNAWLGISGLQKAFDSAAAGEIVYIKGIGDLSKFYTVPFDAESGHLTDGEEVTWHDGAGVVHWTGADMVTPVEIELTSGNAPSDGDTITGTTSTNTITAHSGVAQKGIDVDTNQGNTTSGYIKFIGCTNDADYTVDSDDATDRAIIDGNTSGVHGITGGNIDYVWMENIEVEDLGGSTKYGFYFPTSSADFWVLINCCAHNCSGDGWYIQRLYYSKLIRCVGHTNVNGLNGNASGTGTHVLFSCFRDNSAAGITNATATFIGCILHGNTDDGNASASQVSMLLNCVIDSNGDDGISVASGTFYVFGTRITNHSGSGDIGLNCAGKIVVTGWNYFEDNDGDNIQNATLHYAIPSELSNYIPGTTTPTSTNEEDQADTNEGYAEAVANNNFATGYVDGTDPTLRRTAVTIPWS